MQSKLFRLSRIIEDDSSAFDGTDSDSLVTFEPISNGYDDVLLGFLIFDGCARELLAGRGGGSEQSKRELAWGEVVELRLITIAQVLSVSL